MPTRDRPAALLIWLTLLTLSPVASSQTNAVVPQAVPPASVSAEIAWGGAAGTAGLASESLLVTIALLAVLVIGLQLYRKWQGKTAATEVNGLQLRQSLRLTPRLTVYLLDCRGVEILLAQQGDRLLQLVPPPLPAMGEKQEAAVQQPAAGGAQE